MRILIRAARFASTFFKVYNFYRIRLYGKMDTETDTPTSLWGSETSGNRYISLVFQQTSAYVQRGIDGFTNYNIN